MGIVADYPKQIIVLKGTQLVCGLTGCDAALQEHLIDEIQTREFPEYCHHLLAAKRGNLSLQQQLLQQGAKQLPIWNDYFRICQQHLLHSI
jgi:hypothetical protein